MSSRVLPGKRRWIRWKPEGLLYHASLGMMRDGKFESVALGLVVNESQGGSCIVTRDSQVFFSHRNWVIRVGDMAPVPFKMAWANRFAADLLMFGGEYMQSEEGSSLVLRST